MHVKPNRYRKSFTTTLDPNTLWIFNALSRPNNKGQFIDEIVSDWVSECALFHIPSINAFVSLKNEGWYWQWHDSNDEELGTNFLTFCEAFTWLKQTYPDVNYDIRT